MHPPYIYGEPDLPEAFSHPLFKPHENNNSRSRCLTHTGVCDDSCRVEDCGMDGGDCHSMCSDLPCTIFNQVWNYFADGYYAINHSYACQTMYPAVLIYLGKESEHNCSQWIKTIDYDEDKHLNFRETVAFGTQIINDDESDLKAPQVNCSQCMEMEYYNYHVEP